MKTTFLTLVLLVFGFSSFAFMPSFPAESNFSNSESEKNIAIISETPKTESESKTETKETKTVTAKELTQKMEANYAANKKKMSLKERIANKLLIKKLKKAEKKEVKGSKESKMDSGLTLLFRIIGIVFIIAGALAIIGVGISGGILYGIILIALGILAISLPSII